MQAVITRRAYSAAVWRSLAVTAMPIAAHGRLLIMGDLNAEARLSLRRAGRRQQPSDAALDHLLDMTRISRVHDERQWTYTCITRGSVLRSTIDHILASDISIMLAMASRPSKSAMVGTASAT